MFDKIKFAQLLKKISDTYENQRDFSKKSEINRTYLSQYMNMKLEAPPKPKILEKLANASNNITTYNELMQVCGYTYVTELTPSSYGIDSEYWNMIFGNEKKVSISKEGSTFFASFLDKMVQQSKQSKNEYFEMDFNPSANIPETNNIEQFEEYNKIFCFILCSLISNHVIDTTESERSKLLTNMQEQIKAISLKVIEKKQEDLLKKIGAIPLSDIETTKIPILRNC